MLVLSLSTDTHLLDQHGELFVSQQADTITVSSSVSIGSHEDGDTVHVTNFTVTDGVRSTCLTHEGLLGETSDTHQGVTCGRRNDQETTVHRHIVVVQTLDRAADSSIGQSASSAGVGGSTVSTRVSASVSSSTVTTVGLTTKLDQGRVNFTTQSVTSIISVELTQASQSLSFNDVFDQAAVFPVLVDRNSLLAFGGSDQGNLSRSSLSRSITTGRGWNVNGVTFLTLEVHFLDEVGSNQALLVSSYDFIRPDFWNECCCGCHCHVIST